MSDKDVIGFIGVGYMGHGMAHNIMKGGYPLVIKGNKNRVPVDDLVNSGAREAQDLADLVAQCDVIHMCLSNSPSGKHHFWRRRYFGKCQRRVDRD